MGHKSIILLLYDQVPTLNHFMCIDKLLKNANVLQVGTGKASATALCNETTKTENVSMKQRLKKSKSNKVSTCF